MKKLRILLTFLLFFLSLQVFSYTGGIFYSLHFKEFGLSNTHLNCHSIGGFGYELTGGMQRLGWMISGMMSSIDPGINVLGSLSAGILLGQELVLGPVYGAANVFAGLGVSVSDLGAYPGHLMLIGEVQLELGFYIAPWMQLGLYSTLQGFGNLVPVIPFQTYAFYTPGLGLKVVWHSAGSA